MIVLGLGAFALATTYQLGTLGRMGPGMFPAILGALLALLGVAIWRTRRQDGAETDAGPAPSQWRGWACITAGLLTFILLGQYGGLIPATFGLVFISALGDRQHTLKTAALLAAGVTALGVAIFSWGLQLQFPLFRWG
ncbi:tripartite tricarboxylate transporter TctB family protein [Bordetella holmesii 70147]|nr:tripartite tricarboxylate transporter TctB family protein [Bordetella holmesii 70147]